MEIASSNTNWELDDIKEWLNINLMQKDCVQQMLYRPAAQVWEY